MTDQKVEFTDTEWRSRLTPAQYEVLRHSATEPPGSGELLHVDADGVFRCAGCGSALFGSHDKFDSGSGWPSFDRALAEGTVREHQDRSMGMTRTEITCATCGGHLGHLFPDGPTDTGMRYCINSLALTFESGAVESGAVEPGTAEPRSGPS